MKESAGKELLQQIIKNRQKNGKDPWLTFVSVDYDFIKKHYGILAADWAVQQRDVDMTDLKNRMLTIPNIKEAVEIKEKE